MYTELDKLRLYILEHNVNYKDYCLCTTFSKNKLQTNITIKFENERFNAIKIYGSKLRNILPKSFDIYQDDIELYRNVPINELLHVSSQFMLSSTIQTV